MHYKTIALELLRGQYPDLHRRLKTSRTLLAALDRYTLTLRNAHDAWTIQLSQASPGSDPSQISAEALERALEDLRDRLRAESPPDDGTESPLSLDEAMDTLRRHTPPA